MQPAAACLVAPCSPNEMPVTEGASGTAKVKKIIKTSTPEKAVLGVGGAAKGAAEAAPGEGANFPKHALFDGSFHPK